MRDMLALAIHQLVEFRALEAFADHQKVKLSRAICYQVESTEKRVRILFLSKPPDISQQRRVTADPELFAHIFFGVGLRVKVGGVYPEIAVKQLFGLHPPFGEDLAQCG